MVNRVLKMDDAIKLERLSYWAFQRDFGRSAGMRAPAVFVERLRRKAASAGGAVIEFPTRTTRLSQVCHNCEKVEKKPLAQRRHHCDCGIHAQRDWYSAFLVSCIEDERLNADRARAAWPGADTPAKRPDGIERRAKAPTGEWTGYAVQLWSQPETEPVVCVSRSEGG